ncbi:MAG: inorganic phosphate transporter [Candidatus Acidiferrum sp.]
MVTASTTHKKAWASSLPPAGCCRNAAVASPAAYHGPASHCEITADDYQGGRIIKTMGQSITKLTPFGGFSAETVDSSRYRTFRNSNQYHSHVTEAIVGVGASRRLTAVRWGVTHRIVWAWLMTIPDAALLSATLFRLLSPLLK